MGPVPVVHIESVVRVPAVAVAVVVADVVDVVDVDNGRFVDPDAGAGRRSSAASSDSALAATCCSYIDPRPDPCPRGPGGILVGG